MKLKKLIGVSVLGTVIAIGISGCADDNNGIYTCSKDFGASTIIKIDNDTWDAQENGKWIKADAPKNEGTNKVTLDLKKDTDTNTYTAFMNSTRNNKLDSTSMFTFTVTNQKELLLGSDNSMINGQTCTKNQ